MFSHVMVGISDLDRSKSFYDSVLGTLGVKPGFVDRHRIFWRSPGGSFAASLPINGEPNTVGNGSTVRITSVLPVQSKL
jgi:catechol 2,3-dioxygenase-like lactoylglutathione lyase family enzyme